MKIGIVIGTNEPIKASEIKQLVSAPTHKNPNDKSKQEPQENLTNLITKNGVENNGQNY